MERGRAHEQVIALRDAVMSGGESFAITRAVFSELYPDGARVRYEGADPEGFREQAERRLGMDPAEDDRWGDGARVLVPGQGARRRAV